MVIVITLSYFKANPLGLGILPQGGGTLWGLMDIPYGAYVKWYIPLPQADGVSFMEKTTTFYDHCIL